MRLKTLSFILITCGITLGSCNTGETKQVESNSVIDGTAELTFDQVEHNFGEITQGEKVACVFKFKNSGDGDLLISSATTSCGCTVPRFDKDPISPGESGSVEVLFDSAHREGIQTKTITIRSNASVKIIVLRIVAEVITK